MSKSFIAQLNTLLTMQECGGFGNANHT